ncbi:hypothetical protein [Larkinella terrae]|uniref:Uncharacterized protein n=1 Tax=Larkinella terrae TaxID=2025311 RepID=A0A7K0ET74_9BACT|nr:hypothetical protein [Larkinella terrae]MRS65014.1 hypothetical protein [Larkinella terrae]
MPCPQPEASPDSFRQNSRNRKAGLSGNLPVVDHRVEFRARESYGGTFTGNAVLRVVPPSLIF